MNFLWHVPLMKYFYEIIQIYKCVVGRDIFLVISYAIAAYFLLLFNLHCKRISFKIYLSKLYKKKIFQGWYPLQRKHVKKFVYKTTKETVVKWNEWGIWLWMYSYKNASYRLCVGNMKNDFILYHIFHHSVLSSNVVSDALWSKFLNKPWYVLKENIVINDEYKSSCNCLIRLIICVSKTTPYRN